MKKILVASLIVSASLSIISCSSPNIVSDKSANSSDTTISNADNNISDTGVNQKKALKQYKRYMSKIKSIFDDKGLDMKNLNENVDDKGFVSRILHDDEEENLNEIDKIWYGLTYDENNMISHLGLYLDYNINIEDMTDKNLMIKGTIIEDIGNVFFKRTTYNADIENAINHYLTTSNVEPVELNYKKGKVEVVVRQNKLSINIDLNLE